MVIVPIMQNFFGSNHGKSILTASVLLGIMILPTIISVSESSIPGCPRQLLRGRPGPLAPAMNAACSLSRACRQVRHYGGHHPGGGPAIGETMAVIMIAGNQPQIPGSILDGVRTLTGNIVMEMATHRPPPGSPSSPPAWCCSCSS